MKHSNFIHLHVHTEYSILQSTCRIKSLVKKTEQYKMAALAMTDSASLFAVVPFYETCKSNGIKPIIGVEAYVAPQSLRDKKASGIRNESYSLVLLAKNENGYRNLCKMMTIAQFDGFYYRPRIDKALLEEYGEGLICLSGNLESEIASLVLQNKIDEVKRVIDFYASVFGNDSFYLEILDHGLKQEKLVNQKLAELGKELNIELVAANDCCYLEREDSFATEIARCISNGVTLNEPHPALEGTEYYFKSPDEMTHLFQEYPKAIENTLHIANHCNFELDLSARFMPEFKTPNDQPQESYLLDLCRKGMEGKVDPSSDEVKERLEHEIKIIKQMGFISYFLIVSDFVNYAKQNGIPVGPGRGSAAGSLIAYLLGITNVNPLPFGLLFERFLNPARVSMPDIDIDFCYDRRSEVIDYVSKTYGKRCVAQIITFGTLAARAVIRDVGRVMGMPFPKVDQIAKLIPPEPKMTLQKAINLETKIQELIKEDKEVEGLFDNAVKLEGLPRNTSTHAAGIIISKGELTERLPLYRGQNEEVITQFDGPACEKIGLLKMDFLGLKTLTVLDKALKMVNSRAGKTLIQDLNSIPLDDEKTYELLSKGNTLGVFQLESAGMRDLMKRLGVKDIADIVALVALYRPGPLQMADEFIQRKHKKVKVEYLHPSLEKILKETYGIMLYQEQVMQCAQVMAGFSLAEADNLRRIMGKKKEEAMRELRQQFIDGSIKNKIENSIAEKTFEQMEYFAGYGFNKSHSVAYGLIAYQTAWFKANHPLEFMASILTNEKNNIDKIAFYIEECKAMGIEIKAPSVLHSEDDFTVQENAIRYGLGAIKNVGSNAIVPIIDYRKPGKTFSTIQDFCKAVDGRTLNKKVLESLIRAGAFDELEPNRRYLFEIIDDMIRFGSGSHRDQMSGQVSFLDILDSTGEGSVSPKKKEDYPNWPEHDCLQFEKELLGYYLSGHPLAKYSRILKRFSTINSKQASLMKDGDSIKIGGIISFLKHTKTVKTGDAMCILTLEDLHGTIEAVCYPRIFKQFEPLLTLNAPVFIQGVLQLRNDVPGVIIDEITPIEKVQETLTTAIYIQVHEKNESSVFSKLKKIIEKYPGSCRIMLNLHLVSGEIVLIKGSTKFAILACEHVIQEIEDLFGEESVWLHIKDKSHQPLHAKKSK